MTSVKGAPEQDEPRLTASCRKPNASGSGGHQACSGRWATNRMDSLTNRWVRVTGRCSCKMCKHV